MNAETLKCPSQLPLLLGVLGDHFNSENLFSFSTVLVENGGNEQMKELQYDVSLSILTCIFDNVQRA